MFSAHSGAFEHKVGAMLNDIIIIVIVGVSILNIFNRVVVINYAINETEIVLHILRAFMRGYTTVIVTGSVGNS